MNSRLLILLSLGAAANAAVAFAQDLPNAPTPPGPMGSPLLLTPEKEIQVQITEMKNLLRKIDAAGKLRERPSLQPSTVKSIRNLETARELFLKREYDATALILVDYLNTAQVTSPEEYLEAQFILAKSYEAVGNKAGAVKALIRYLGAYVSHQKSSPDTMIAAIKMLLPLANAIEGEDAKKMSELLASLSSLELPEGTRADVMFHAAAAAERAKISTTAMRWYLEAATAKDPATKAKALYHAGLMALRQKNYDDAEAHFSAVVAVEGDGAAPRRDNAHLSLGRIAVYRKKPNRALVLYGKIPVDAAAYREALFERVYVHLDLRQMGEARVLAAEYLEKFKDGQDAFQLRTLSAYLDLQAGRLDEARASIEESNRKLDETYRWLVLNFSTNVLVSEDDIVRILAATGAYLLPPPFLEQGAALFKELAEHRARLAGLRADIRTTVLTIGRANLSILKPQWAHQFQVLSDLGEAMLLSGHRLSSAEQALYDARLTNIQKAEIAALMERRFRILEPLAELSRRRVESGRFLQIQELGNGMFGRHSILRNAKAELSALSYVAQSTDGPGSLEKTRQVQALGARGMRLEKDLNRTLEIIRARSLEDLLKQHPHSDLRQKIRDYAAILYEESVVLAGPRNTFENQSQKFLSEDAVRAWGLWQFSIGRIYNQIVKVEKDGQESLAATLRLIDQQIDTFNVQYEKVQQLNLSLETTLGARVQAFIAHYRNQADLKKSRNRKWLADIEWLQFQAKNQERDSKTAKFSLQNQILEENLKDLEQGDMWQRQQGQ